MIVHKSYDINTHINIYKYFWFTKPPSNRTLFRDSRICFDYYYEARGRKSDWNMKNESKLWDYKFGWILTQSSYWTFLFLLFKFVSVSCHSHFHLRLIYFSGNSIDSTINIIHNLRLLFPVAAATAYWWFILRSQQYYLYLSLSVALLWYISIPRTNWTGKKNCRHCILNCGLSILMLIGVNVYFNLKRKWWDIRH